MTVAVVREAALAVISVVVKEVGVRAGVEKVEAMEEVQAVVKGVVMAVVEKEVATVAARAVEMATVEEMAEGEMAGVMEAAATGGGTVVGHSRRSLCQCRIALSRRRHP